MPLYSMRAKGKAASWLVFRDYDVGRDRRKVVSVRGFKKRSKNEGFPHYQKAIKQAQTVWRDLSDEERQLWEFAFVDQGIEAGNEAFYADLPAYHKFMSEAVKAFLSGEEIPRAPRGGLFI